MATHHEYNMTDLLRLMVIDQAEALSVRPGQAPIITLHGLEHRVEVPVVTPEKALSLFQSVADADRMQQFHEHGKVDFLVMSDESAKFKITAEQGHGEIQFEIRPAVS